MNKLFKALMITLVIAGTACTTQAQDDDKKIKIVISKQVDGETKTFKGEYASEEEMLNDPEYREFAGDDENVSVFFGGAGLDKMVRIHKGGPGARAFSFQMDDDDFPKHMRHLGAGHGPGVFMFSDGDAFAPEEFEKELADKMKALEEKMKGLDKGLQEEIMESMREIEEMHTGMIPRMTKRGGISVEDVGSDFGKRGTVEAAYKLELDDISYMVMQKRLNLSFRMQEKGEMSIKISNEAGKEIYSRYYESFTGNFSDSIDFNKYSSGKYLLEISQGKKRMTKKLVID